MRRDISGARDNLVRAKFLYIYFMFQAFRSLSNVHLQFFFCNFDSFCRRPSINSILNISCFWQNLHKFAVFAILTVFAVFEEAFKIWQFLHFLHLHAFLDISQKVGRYKIGR